MSLLTQCMYSDLNCKSFGLSYGQIKIDAVVKNAGWFNQQGERLGSGDISFQNLVDIHASIGHTKEKFYILSEADAGWNMPSTLDRLSPGVDYVVDHAVWFVDSDIIKIVQDSSFDIRSSSINGHLYFEANLDYIKSLNNKTTSIANPSCRNDNVIVKSNDYYGLTTYQFEDGVKWAYAPNKVIAEDAAFAYIQDKGLWHQELKIISEYINLDDTSIKILNHISDKYDEQCNQIFRVICGDYLNAIIIRMIKQSSLSRILGIVDCLEHKSGDIVGLPGNGFAYQIE